MWIMTTFLRKFSEKLTKLRLIISKIRDKCVKTEPEEYHSMDEQIIPTKRKHSSIPQRSPRNGSSKTFLKQVVQALCTIIIFMIWKVKIVVMKSTSTCQSLLKLLMNCVLTCLVMSNIKCFLACGFRHVIYYYI